MVKSYGVVVVAHVIIVSAQVLLVLTLGLWTLGPLDFLTIWDSIE